MLELTERAREVLTRASAAAVRLNPDARIRLTMSAAGLAPALSDEPEPGDTELRLGDAVIFVQGGVRGLVDVEDPHDKLVLRPG